MKVSEILQLDVFNNAVVKTKEIGLDRDVDSVMVLEATDIERWGKKNQLILTSYFALKEMSYADLEVFFEKLVQIDIGGIVLKINRLIDETPEELLNLCIKHRIPLIEVKKDTIYEKIVVAIYEPLLNYQSYLLRTYYDASRTFSKIKTASMSYEEIMAEAYRLINRSCRLTIPNHEVFIAYGEPFLTNSVTINKKDVSTEYTNNYYTLLEVQNPATNELSHILQVRNNALDFWDFTFEILQDEPDVKASDIMIIENVMDVVQNELHKEFYIKNERYIIMNNIAASILFNTASSEAELDSLLEETGMLTHSYYQAVGFMKQSNSTPEKVRRLRKLLQSISVPNIYYENRKYIMIIYNIENKQHKITKEMVKSVLPSKMTHKVFIADVKNREKIGELFQECLDMFRFNMKYNLGQIINIHDLGVFRYLTDVSRSKEQDVIPDPLLDLKQNHPDLFDTFFTFLHKNQNYKQTAEEMFLHPKTIRYRINRAQEIMDIDIHNPIQLLNYSTGAYLLNLYDGHGKI